MYKRFFVFRVDVADGRVLGQTIAGIYTLASEAAEDLQKFGTAETFSVQEFWTPVATTFPLTALSKKSSQEDPKPTLSGLSVWVPPEGGTPSVTLTFEQYLAFETVHSVLSELKKHEHPLLSAASTLLDEQALGEGFEKLFIVPFEKLFLTSEKR